MRRLPGAVLVAAGLAFVPAAAAEHAASQGVAMDFEAKRLGTTRAGEDVRLTVRLSDASSGAPLAAANPAAWLSLNRTGGVADQRGCQRKVSAFLGGNPFSRPDVDLTGFTLLAMNRDATISVIDPRGGFGGSRMLAMLRLDSPAGDWAIRQLPPRLYVSEPASKRLGVFDAERWESVGSVPLADPPGAVLLPPDGGDVWVAAARDGGVSAVPADGLAVAATLKLGRGKHWLAGDGRWLLASNGGDGSVTVIDATERTVTATVAAAAGAGAIAFSGLAKLGYVTTDDGVVAIDPARGVVVERIGGITGAAAIAISPDGRWGFAASPSTNRVIIFDTATNRVTATLTVENAPYAISFSDTEAYIRRRDSESVTLVPLAPLRTDGSVAGRAEFPAGEKPVAALDDDLRATSMAGSPGEPAMLLASPAERAIHYYHEGMAAPADSFDDLGHQPVAVLVADHSLRQTARGTYSAVARLPKAGRYDVVLLLDSPRVAHCFTLDAEGEQGPGAGRPLLQAVGLPPDVAVGAPVSLTFRVAGRVPRSIGAMVILSPGTWFARVPMNRTEDGTWHMQFTPPQAGIYVLAFDAPDLGLEPGSLAHFSIEATERAHE